MYKILFSFIGLFSFFHVYLYAQNSQDFVQRTSTILPNFEAPFNVQLYIPENYKLILHDENEYFIGPNTLDKNFIEHLESIKEPLLQAIKQTGMKSFEKDAKLMVSQMQQQFPNNFEADFSRWGSYPFVAIKMTIGMDNVYFAQVSLNDPAGTALIFRLVYPSAKDFGNGNKPRKEDLIFWQNFLNKTIPLN